MIDTSLLWFIGALAAMNVAAAAYTLHMLFYGVSGLKFLGHVYAVLIKNDEAEEAETLSTQDAPRMANAIIGIRNILYFIFLTICVNSIIGLFAIFPGLQLTGAWTIMIWTAAIGNAYVMVSMRPFPAVKFVINATCESYNVLIESFEHIKEYEESNNDSHE